jgi:hypothetical protein
MSARQHMTQRAGTQRPVETSDGGGGVTETYVSYLTAVPCWWSPISNAETIFSSQMGTNPTGRVYMPRATDIDERDVITSVVDRQGTMIMDGPLRVEAVIKRLDHLEIYCTQRRS